MTRHEADRIGADARPAPRLLFLITEGWFFSSHFFDRALAARDAGYDVHVAARLTKEGPLLHEAGLTPHHVGFNRRNTGPFGELKTLRQIVRLYKAVRPDIVVHVALKPILYGSIAARLARIHSVINAPVGMGYLFTSRDARARIVRPIVEVGLRRLLNPPGSKVVVENGDDRDALIRSGWVKPENAVVIRGAGVDTGRFEPVDRPERVPVVALVARMLWSKGVGEFIAAGHILRRAGIPAQMLLVGAPDIENPASVAPAQLHAWDKNGDARWLGHRADVADVLTTCDIACLPSYREGLPKSLLEAMAAGLPIVTTDVIGCRETVRDGVNGILVPPHDPEALAAALGRLVGDPTLRRRMGEAGRKRAEIEFSSEIVNTETLALFRSMLSGAHGQHRDPLP